MSTGAACSSCRRRPRRSSGRRGALRHFRVIATRAKIEDGRYTGELEFYCEGEGKAEAIREVAAREGVDLSESYAYSDSISDIPMLEAVGHPVAVNPDRDLRKVAAEREWQVRDFRRPVRLRERLAVPKPPPKIRLRCSSAPRASSSDGC